MRRNRPARRDGRPRSPAEHRCPHVRRRAETAGPTRPPSMAARTSVGAPSRSAHSSTGRAGPTGPARPPARPPSIAARTSAREVDIGEVADAKFPIHR
jgi:hypothetical protein